MSGSDGAIIDGDFFSVFRRITEISDPPVETDGGIDRLYDKLEIANFVSSLADAMDSKDLGRILDHFADDAVVESTEGRFVTRAEIEGHYRAMTERNRITYHRIASLTVRIPQSDRAVVCGYLHTPLIASDTDGRSLYGRFIARLSREPSGWCIAEWRESTDHIRAFPGE